MKVYKIPTNGGHYNFFKGDDVEYASPIEYYAELIKQYHFHRGYDILIRKEFPQSVSRKQIIEFMEKEAAKEWQKQKAQIEAQIVPENLIKVLNTNKKREQVKLLKGISISPSELLAFVFKASAEFGYSFSNYTSEHLPRDIEKEKLPTFFYFDNKEDKMDVLENTTYSNSQLKHVLNFRHVMVAKFLDKGDQWHCLFSTYKSVNGKEQWDDGTPHCHYISNSFGMSREKVLQELRSRDYKLNSTPHIGLVRYKD